MVSFRDGISSLLVNGSILLLVFFIAVPFVLIVWFSVHSHSSGKASPYDNKPKYFQKAAWDPNIKQIATAVQHSFILLDDGTLWGSGLNTKGTPFDAVHPLVFCN
jgi:ABC-type spermidine/putrescine transport system permease subunit II